MKVLIVKDRKTGRPMEIPTSSIPKEIRPDNWFENAYWMSRTDRNVLEPLIRALYEERNLASVEIQILAQYIIDYACHIAVMAYLFGGGQETLEFNAECIKTLRFMACKARTKRDIRNMINKGMEYALDPF